jgi:farnesyl diphosphate synthase
MSNNIQLFTDFESYLNNNLPVCNSFHPIFQEALVQMLNAGGKRFRPMLLLSVVEALNPLLLRNSMSVALAIELLHTYSLIHDDLPAMDNAYLRRGKPTLHTSFDEVTAILVGDALNTHCFNVLSHAPLSAQTRIDLVQVLSNDGGINGMIIGQAIDCYFENTTLELEKLEFLHIHKTAKLIAASLKMAAIIVGLNKSKQNELYNFGQDIGLLFQIQDDIIDETMSSEDAGKTTSNDEEKNSFVNLLGLNEAINSANKLAKKCEYTLDSFDSKLKDKLSIILQKYLYRHLENK